MEKNWKKHVATDEHRRARIKKNLRSTKFSRNPLWTLICVHQDESVAWVTQVFAWVTQGQQRVAKMSFSSSAGLPPNSFTCQ